MSNQIDFKTDFPIKSEAQDKFGWSAYAKKVATTIQSVDAEDSSFVVALQGPWGSGKTSFLNLVENEFSAQSGCISTAWFNPWFFQSERDLLLSFFQLLAAKTEVKPKRAKKVVAKFKEYSFALAGAGSGLAAVLPGTLDVDPVMGVGMGVAGVAAEQLVARKKESGKKEACLSDLKADLDKELRKQERILVVFIDDLDRLSSEEIRLVFKIVTLTASFPKIIYVLSFDRTVVSRALSEVQDFDGDLYLEKIVQLPVDLPPISRKEVRAKVNALFESLNQDGSFRYSSNDSLRLESIGLNLVASSLNTPRRLIRFENALALKRLHVGEEIEPIDLLGMVSIQLFFPKVFEWVKRNALYLCNEQRSGLHPEHDVAEEKLGELKELVGEKASSSDGIAKAVCALFPRLGDADYYSAAKNSPKSKRAAGRICSIDLFKLYIGYEAGQGLSHRELVDVVLWSSSDQLMQHFDRELEHGSLIDVVYMIEDSIEFLTNERACLLAQVLACYLGKCGNETRGLLGAIGFDRAYLRLMTRLSKRFEKEGLTNSLLSAFENFDDDNWQGFAFILRYEANDRAKGDKDSWMSDNGFIELSRRYIKLAASRAGKMLKSGYFTELGAWRDAESIVGGETYDRFLKSLQDNRPMLVLYEASRLSEWTSGSAKGYGLSDATSGAPQLVLGDITAFMASEEYLSASSLAQVKVAALSLLLRGDARGCSYDDSVSKADALKLANEARESLGAGPLEEGFDG